VERKEGIAMPIQPTNYFGMGRQVAEDVAAIPGSIVQGVKQGAELGLLFDKFKQAEEDSKVFNAVKSDFIRDVRTSMADDPRGDRIIKLAAQARSMPELSTIAKNLMASRDAEEQAKGKVKFDASMLALEGSADIFGKKVKDLTEKEKAERAEKIEGSAEQKLQRGTAPEEFSTKEFAAAKPQLEFSALQEHRKRMQELEKAKMRLMKAKEEREKGRQARMDRFEALKVTQQARLGIDMSNDAIRDAQKNYQTISGSYAATDDDKQNAFNAIQKAREDKFQWDVLLKVGQELLRDDEKFREAQKKVNEDKKRNEGAKEIPALIQRPAYQSPYAQLLGFEPANTPRRIQTQMAPASPTTTNVASTRRRGTGF